MTEAATHRLHLRALSLPARVPVDPALGKVAVEEVAKRLRLRILAATAQVIAPRREASRKLTVQHEAETLLHRLKRRGALLDHLHPTLPATRQLLVEQVTEAATHRLHLRTVSLPHSVPANPAASKVAVEEVPQSLRHR